jgi:AraC-like DNA-binding protein
LHRFHTFPTHYRVAEARRRLAERGHTDKLITIAMVSGFASLASFNRAFRMIEVADNNWAVAVVIGL